MLLNQREFIAVYNSVKSPHKQLTIVGDPLCKIWSLYYLDPDNNIYYLATAKHEIRCFSNLDTIFLWINAKLYDSISMYMIPVLVNPTLDHLSIGES